MQESKRSALTINASMDDRIRRDEIRDEAENETEDETENEEHGVLVSHGSARAAFVVVGC
jgi:hypothetical protein